MNDKEYNMVYDIIIATFIATTIIITLWVRICRWVGDKALVAWDYFSHMPMPK